MIFLDQKLYHLKRRCFGMPGCSRSQLENFFWEWAWVMVIIHCFNYLPGGVYRGELRSFSKEIKAQPLLRYL